MLKKFIFSLTAVMALSLVVMAQGGKNDVTLTGAIVDTHCSKADMATHKRSCVTADPCLKSGLGVFADGKFTPFTEKSSAQAKAALEKSKKDSGAKFKVTGTVVEGKIEITKIEEVA